MIHSLEERETFARDLLINSQLKIARVYPDLNQGLVLQLKEEENIIIKITRF